MTAAAIAAEAGVDDFVAEATPETKLELIREYQRKGHLYLLMTVGWDNDASDRPQAGCRCGDEFRYTGSEGSRQYGGS